MDAFLHQLDVILSEAKNLHRYGRMKKVGGIRWVAAPAVHGVALAGNEEVQWSWTHTINGSYVSGSSIVQLLSKKRQRPFAALRVTTAGGVRE